MHERKHLICVNNYFYVVFTSCENVCTAIKVLFHVCRHRRETKQTEAIMPIVYLTLLVAFLVQILRFIGT